MRINPTKLGCDRDPTSDETCFELESCFQIRNFPVNIETTIVRYKIMAEIYEGGKKISRVRFATNNGDLAHSIEKNVQVRKNNLDGCFKELVYLKQGTIDIRSPIKFLVEYSLGLDQPTIQGKVFQQETCTLIKNYLKYVFRLSIELEKICKLVPKYNNKVCEITSVLPPIITMSSRASKLFF